MLKPARPFHIACILLLSVHFALAVVYSFVTPLWESNDEAGHYAYARYLSIHWALPPLGAHLSYYDETHQPPLYYILIAPAIALVDTSDNVEPIFTPLGILFAGAKPELHLAPAGVVTVTPDVQLNTFPYHGTALAIHLGRIVSAFLSTVAVLLTYLTVRTLLPNRLDVALLSTGIHALWPQFLYMGGAITNDIGIGLAGAWVLWASARVVMRHRPIDYALLALSLAAATMMKDSALALLLFGAIVVCGLLVYDLFARNFRRLLNATLFAGLLTILIGLGTLLSDGRSARQFTTGASYALTPLTFMSSSSIEEAPPQNIGNPIESLPGNLLYYSLVTFFAAFGHSSIRMKEWWYDLARLSAAVAALGLIWSLLRRRAVIPILLLLLCTVCITLAPITRSVLSQNLTLLTGRFFFPALSAVAILIALALLSFPRPANRLSATFVFTGIGLAALAAPFITIAPAYKQPSMLDPVATPTSMQISAPITFGDSIQLLGYSQPLTRTAPGGASLIELYWRALKPMNKNYILRIESFNLEGQSFRARLDGFPGSNVFPTSFWKPGDTFAETYYLPIKPDVPAPSLETFKISWLDPDAGNLLEPLCKDGHVCEPRVGTLPVMLDSSSAARYAGKPALYRIGDSADLVEFSAPANVQAGQSVTLSLVWRARSAEQPLLTTFVHVLSAEGKLAAQSDSPARGGFYPTSVWTTSEIIPDQYTLRFDQNVSAGTYLFAVGMYDPLSGQRLPTFDAAGVALRDNTILLQEITVR